MVYVGYHKNVKSSIDYSGAEVFTSLVQYNDSMFMHISVWQQDTDEYEDFLNSVVLPIVNSVTIEEPEHENTSPQTLFHKIMNRVNWAAAKYEYFDYELITE